MNNKFKNYFFIILAGVLLPTIALTQTTLTFTNAASTGQFGPNQTQVNAAYDGTTLDDAVTINTEGIQEWTVPATGVYTIEVWGAQGGNNGWYPGGKGARMKGDFTLSANDVLKFVVGQQGYTSDTYRAGGPAGVVNGNYCACRRVDERTDRIRINAQTHGVDIGKSEFGTRPSERTRSGHKGVRRHDYVGPRLHVEEHR